MTLDLRLSAMGFECWLDQKATTITKESMEAGVAAAQIFLLFLSEGVLTRPFCLFEIKTAMQSGKKMVLVHETDARHGAFDFSEVSSAPSEIAKILQTHESLPWRRRRFEQDGILAELLKNSGLTPPSASEGSTPVNAVGTGVSSTGDGGDCVASGFNLAPIPDTVPVTPEAFSPREVDAGQLPQIQPTELVTVCNLVGGILICLQCRSSLSEPFSLQAAF